MVIKELLREIELLIQNSDNKRFEAELIIMSVLRLTRTEFLLNKDREVTREEKDKILEFAMRRSKNEPLSYILGNAEFMGMSFNVNRDTLIPRPDTETLVEYVINYIGDRKFSVLDIGTGSGCIGISIAKFCKNANVTLIDINETAVKTAVNNAKLNNVNVKAKVCDILIEVPDGKFDVIVSNPPYIKTDVIKTLQEDVRAFEPLRALDGGYDGLKFYRRIAEISKEMLNENGMLAFEIGYDEGEEIKVIMKDFNNVEVICDLCGNDRVSVGYKKNTKEV